MDLLLDLEEQLKNIQTDNTPVNTGKILSVGDGVAQVSGLSQVGMSEILEFPGNTYGVVLNLKKDGVGVIILGNFEHLKEGDLVRSTGKTLSIPVSDNLLGHVVNPLGQFLDGSTAGNKPLKFMPLEKIAPGVIQRQPVDIPLQTGLIAIDSMIPIGRGQRELIIGDRGTGKTAIVIDTIINQKGSEKPVICIYVAIGQKQSKIAQAVAKLTDCGAMKYTIIVSANASDSASLQYLAPYAGVAVAEYFLEQGKDVLIAYDDLSKHAWAYRQLSLILRRPSGREAYPGDVFYLHSRLLERACRLNKDLGGGSITALPIIETLAGDVSAYIPTNVISITDGQIYLENDLFNAGIRPALNVGISVSRVGGAAQIKAMKQVAGKLKLDMASYREMAAFAQFGSDLDKATQDKLSRGQRITELLKQPQYEPLAVEEQIAILWAVNNNYLDNIPIPEVTAWKQKFISYMKKKYNKILENIVKERQLTESLIKELKEALDGFVKTN